MGEPRFRQLEKQVPDHVSILGLDEHTACILDLKKQEAQVRGLGSVCIRRQGKEIVFSSGETFSLDVLRNPSANIPKTRNVKETNKQLPVSKKEDANFWNTIHSIESKYTAGIEKNNVNQLINALLDFDKTLWIELENTESAEFISQAREKFREMIVGLQTILASAKVTDNRLKHLTEELLSLRADFRQKNHWKKADEIRSRLEKCGIIIDDSPAESSWRIKE
jgi:cysteinyl-tRNA synthetase